MILFVDDDEDLLAGLRRRLSRFYRIDTAASGPDALAMIRANGPYAVIVSDIAMPGMDGITFLKEANKLSPDSVKLALSGQGERDTVIDIVNEAGIFRYLAKPVSHAAMREALDAAIAKYLDGQQEHLAAPLANTSFVELGRYMERALANNEMFVQYQPQVGLADGKVHGVEALIRWYRPASGVIPPDEFIPVAEVNGTIVPLTHWLLETVCRDLADWRARRLPLKAAVNISPAHFDRLDLVEAVQRTIATTGADPHSLELEVTETVLAENIELMRDSFDRLTKAGIGIALDDFGSGFMRYSYLRQMPIVKLKIDGSFVRNMEHEKASAAIVESLVGAGLSLGITVVAEAVENGEQARLLRDMGCTLGQGFYFAPPLPCNDLLDWIRERRATVNGVPESLS
jgi:EAL domain-containing protein (putative c-di-GMP-specific phosphodiesterase class I)